MRWILLAAIVVLVWLTLRRLGLRSMMLSGDRAKDLARLRPRLVTADYAKHIEERLGKPIPSRPFFATGLCATCVIDNPRTVVYLTREMQAELQLSDDELFRQAVDNLRATFPKESVAQIIQGGQLAVIKGLDGHDAARLILLPEYLEDGQEVAATVPDTDTLTICPVPQDWSQLRELATKAASRPLLPKPLHVRKGAVTVVE